MRTLSTGSCLLLVGVLSCSPAAPPVNHPAPSLTERAATRVQPPGQLTTALVSATPPASTRLERENPPLPGEVPVVAETPGIPPSDVPPTIPRPLSRPELINDSGPDLTPTEPAVDQDIDLQEEFRP